MGAGLVAVVAAGAVWVGALVGGAAPVAVAGVIVVGGLVAVAVAKYRVVGVLMLVGIGMASGIAASGRNQATLTAAIPQGPGTISGVAATDSQPYGDRYRFVIRPQSWESREDPRRAWRGPPLAVVTDGDGIVAGDQVVVQGLLLAVADLVRGDPVSGRVTAKNVSVVGATRSVALHTGNIVRQRVQHRLAVLAGSAESALLAGFLIGDIAELPQADTESLRRAGLTHFVAVSGSNVALVLGAWWLVLGPLGAGNRIRAATGLLVLSVFVIVTRWESSVIRAATMAALVLGGRATGIPIDAWTALGGAVTILLTLSGDLAYDVGFQLSVAATAGVLLGSRLWSDRSPRVIWAALAATVSAQLAVIPLLLLHFGTVPLLSPVANLLAAPLVTVATALAGIGVIVSWDPPLHLAEDVARLVLAVARAAGRWPQLGLSALVAIAGGALLATRERLRPVILGIAVVVTVVALTPSRPPAVPTVTFIDVGQGDAILLRDPSGAAALVDGGRDPEVLRSALRRYGLSRIDLLVATHGDADHAGGLVGLVDRIDVGRFWIPANQDLADILPEVVTEMAHAGVGVDEKSSGDRARVGEFEIAVLGPQRRYVKENDGSVVLWVTVKGQHILLAGDIEAVAQRELDPLHPDLLLVPHHGSATTDLDWLAKTVGPVAIISVGENTYGHPAPDVLQVLEGSGADVATTQDEGDISVPFP